MAEAPGRGKRVRSPLYSRAAVTGRRSAGQDPGATNQKRTPILCREREETGKNPGRCEKENLVNLVIEEAGPLKGGPRLDRWSDAAVSSAAAHR